MFAILRRLRWLGRDQVSRATQHEAFDCHARTRVSGAFAWVGAGLGMGCPVAP